MRPFPIQVEGMMELVMDCLHNLADAGEPAPPWPKPSASYWFAWAGRRPGPRRSSTTSSGWPRPQSPWQRHRNSARASRHWPGQEDGADSWVGTRRVALWVRFPHPPLLEPDLRLSPHPAQHFQISLGLSSVAWCIYRLEVAHAISLRWFITEQAIEVHKSLLWVICCPLTKFDVSTLFQTQNLIGF